MENAAVQERAQAPHMLTGAQRFYIGVKRAADVALSLLGLVLLSPVLLAIGIAIVLDDDHYRALLLYKALANISFSDIASLNELLQKLTHIDIGGFNGNAYVLETGVMKIRWVFEYFLSDMQKAIFEAAGTLARGAGVGWEIYPINPLETFGFNGAAMQPFCQAPFAAITVTTGADKHAYQRTE